MFQWLGDVSTVIPHTFAACSLFHPTLVPQLEDVYGQVFKVLKPGALFVTYEWVATPKFDASNPEHVKIMDEINYGNGLPVRRGEGGGA